MKRYEVKFISSIEHLESIKMLLESNSLCFKEHFENRQVNNMYFDDLNLKRYYDSEEGVSIRSKLRLRWYEKIFPNSFQPKLEIKEKYGLLNSKKTFLLKKYNFNDFMQNPKNFVIQEAKNVENSVFFMENLIDNFPTIMNSYQRYYYISKNNKVRATIDYDLKYLNVNKFSLYQNNFFNDLIVLEIKFDENDYNIANNFITTLPLRIKKFSKYVVGVKTINKFH